MYKQFNNKILKLNNNIDGELLQNIRILEVNSDYLIGVDGYYFHKFDLKTKKWSFISKIESKYTPFAKYSLIRRLLRVEVTKLYSFANGEMFCIAKKGIYRIDKESGNFKKCFHIRRGSRPLSLCQDKNGTIYFGEYFANVDKKPVHIYKSSDNGDSWTVAYTFRAKEINHIHGIYLDKYSDKIWVVTGDRDQECIIGYTENGFKSLKIVFRGGQEYRTCGLLFYPDFIVFATDSQYIKNKIKYFDRKNLKLTEIDEIQGSCIYTAQCGNVSLMSTTIEPSAVNLDQNSYLWISFNGKKWIQMTYFKKDFLPKTLFQFGSIRFPNYQLEQTELTKLYFTGRALEKVDGSTVSIEIKNLNK